MMGTGKGSGKKSMVLRLQKRLVLVLCQMSAVSKSTLLRILRRKYAMNGGECAVGGGSQPQKKLVYLRIEDTIQKNNASKRLDTDVALASSAKYETSTLNNTTSVAHP